MSGVLAPPASPPEQEAVRPRRTPTVFGQLLANTLVTGVTPDMGIYS